MTMTITKINDAARDDLRRIDIGIKSGDVFLRDLYKACVDHFWAVRGNGTGIGVKSCCAAGQTTTGKFRFGNSRLAGDYVIESGTFSWAHAEQALWCAVGYNETLINIVYVDLKPCATCRAYFKNFNLNFYYLFDNAQEMSAAHSKSCDAQYQLFS